MGPVAWRALAATDGDHDLEPVAGGQGGFGMAALGYDFAVALDRQALAGKLHLFKQRADGGRGGDLAGFAVDLDIDHLMNAGAVRYEPLFYRMCACRDPT